MNPLKFKPKAKALCVINDNELKVWSKNGELVWPKTWSEISDEVFQQ